MRGSIRNTVLFNRSKTLQATPKGGSFSAHNRALIIERITPSKRGRLHHAATDWFAVSADGTTIEAGTTVELLGRQGLTYTVRSTARSIPQIAA
ncbi:NfeD family protein [Nodosilinea sp. LEGE 07088]|uniref:NfeD family protein n=1 Tax=Nodosilinea sp. LEGE 07088 TaxID=2777968 RepID=UPI0018821F48|nr:NfeD family protein [Nodosilinea sp. LEGE 07088]MBE9138421.1 NfeD family protein [Nodosilinea sp. LEGE 07088]